MKNVYKKLTLTLFLFTFLFTGKTYSQDAGVTQLLSPTNFSCGLKNGAVQVIVYNYGSTSISNIPVKLSASGPSSFSLADTLKKSISAGNQDTLTFKSTINTSSGGTWQLKVWSSLSSDINHGNDTLATTLKINPQPIAPSGSAGISCGAGDVTFTASSGVKGATTYWYSDTTSSVPFASGDTISENISANTTYYAASASGKTFDSLSTTFSGTNMTKKGNMFNINVLRDITIDSLDVDFATKVNDTVFVYYKAGTYSGYQTNSSAWTYVGKYFVKPASTFSPARAVIGGLSLKGGNLYGLYVTLKISGGSITKSLSYLAQTSSGDSAQNSDMIIYSGDALANLFSTNSNGYEWNGRVYYSKQGCISSRVAISGTVKPVVKSLLLSKDKTSAGALNLGTSSNPDMVCVKDTLKYDIGVPLNFTDADYGTKWKLSFSLKSAKGYEPTNFTITYPSSTTKGLITFFPKAIDADSVYILTITATDFASGCDSTFTRYINAKSVIVPGFTVSNTCYGQPVVPDNTATPAGLGFNWDFGDGNSLTGATQSYLYKNPGNYTITQTALNGGCQASTSKFITIYNSPIGAVFTKGTPFNGQFNDGTTLNPDYACIGDTNTYQVTPPKGLLNSDYGKKWVITSISLQTLSGSPAYIKDTATKFPVSGKSATFRFSPTKNGDSLFLLKFDIKTIPGNCDSTIYRFVKSMTKPVPDFAFTNNCMGTPLGFKDKSTISFYTSISNWTWDFGDGTGSALQNPTHDYAKAGTYTVKLTPVSTEGCGSTVSKTVEQYPLPVISYGQVTECSGFATKFLDSSSISTGSITGWAWDFGDATTSSLESPSHIYTTSGSYTVNLVETSSFGCTDTLAKTNTILQSPVAGFHYKNGCTGSPINFSNISTDPAGSPQYEWDFGTGSFSSRATSPAYTFPLNGNYNTRLVVISGNGCTDTSSQIITPYPKPIVNIVYGRACVGVAVSYSDTGTNDGNSTYTWKYGDKDSDQLIVDTIKHTYTSSGTYNVSLSVQNGNYCIDSAQASVVVAAFPKAGFTTADICINKQPAAFVNTSTGSGSLAYLWNLGDNSKTSAATNVTHTYTNAGTYEVKLTTTNASGCADTISKSININPLPVIGALTQKQNANMVTFNPQDTSIGTFKWYSGDPGKDSSSLKEPTFTYPPNNGKYQVRLFVTSTQGCTAEKTDSVVISNSSIEQSMINLDEITIFPNPFSGITHINYTLQSRSNLNITVYDLTGKQVAVLKNGTYGAGTYSDVFDATKSHCPEGMYILKMTVNDQVYTTRIEDMR